MCACGSPVGAARGRRGTMVAALMMIALLSNGLYAGVIFDSYSEPNIGGLTSRDTGALAQVSVSRDTVVNNISVLNRMPTSGHLKFFIFSAATRGLLLETPAVLWDAEPGAVPSWKTSPDFSFTLLAGNQYVIGSAGDVDWYDVADTKAESANGISSDLIMWTAAGFAPVRNVRPFWTGADCGIRLLAVPEPSMLWLAAGVVAAVVRRKR
jgi:hypothetical protein